jgi:hypothetical protein
MTRSGLRVIIALRIERYAKYGKSGCGPGARPYT